MEFFKHEGLCQSIELMYPKDPLNSWGYRAVEVEIQDQFRDAGLSMGYPFGMRNYDERIALRTQHLCPIRLAWVLDHINNPPANQSEKLSAFYKAWYEWATTVK